MLTISPLTLADQETLVNLIHLYRYDIATYDPSMQPDTYGKYTYKWLSTYFSDPTRFGLVAKVNNIPVGFCLVNEHARIATVPNTKAIAEFRVSRHFRKQGIGEQLACMAFDVLPGSREVAVQGANTGAQLFRKRFISTYVQGKVTIQKHTTDEESRSVFLFDSTAKIHK